MFLKCLVGLLLFAGVPQEETVKGKLGRKLDKYLERETFSGQVLVAVKGKVVLSKAYGMADRNKKKANTLKTIFDIGSVSKQFTATAILKLEMQGKLKTSDPISKYLDDVPKDKAGITIHHLVTHTSGIPNTSRRRVNWGNKKAAIDGILVEELESKPGEKFKYNNRGYCLLAAIVEKASGKSFEAYVKENLFKPAGMPESGFCRDAGIRPFSCARGYEGDRDKGPAVEAFYAWGHRGATGVLTTSEELWKWEKALQGGKLLNKAARKKLFTPFKRGYAYGWYVVERGGKIVSIEHGGSTIGFESYFLRTPNGKVVIIFNMNQRGGQWKIRSRLLELALEED